MDSPTTWDFGIVTDSGLTQQEFAALARVSRITVIHWLQGRRQPSRHVAPRLSKLLRRLTAAVEAGTLPPQTPRRRNGSDAEYAATRTQEIIHALR